MIVSLEKKLPFNIIAMTTMAIINGMCFSSLYAATDVVIGDERAVKQHLEQSDLSNYSFKQIVKHGQVLFDARFTVLDGAGRPAATSAEVPVKRRKGNVPSLFRTAGPDANACSGCHNQPSSGGAGDFVANAFTAEGVTDFEFDTVDPQFSNERGTPHLHGSGYVELLAREMSIDLQAIRAKAVAKARSTKRTVAVKLISKGVSFGELSAHADGFIDINRIDGVDHDLVVRPFGQKGVFTSLRQFSINAMNAHHGIQSDERWGMQWTHSNDFDEDDVKREITSGDISAVTLFQASLPLPISVLPENKVLKHAAVEGERLFVKAACDQCHRQTLPLRALNFVEPGPFNLAGNLRQTDGQLVYKAELSEAGLKKDANGNWLIPIFSDLKRHVIADADKPHFANEGLSQRFSARDEFMTAKLWGVGSTAPYGHRGDVTTLMDVILHHGGAAKESRLQFEGLTDLEQRKIVEYLKTLQLTPVNTLVNN